MESEEKQLKEVVSLKACPKISFQITITGGNHMNYKIEQWPAFTISGIRKRIETEKAFEIVPKIWETAGNDGTMEKLFKLLGQADMRPVGLLGVSAGGQWGASEEMDYYLGVTTCVDVPECIKVSTPEDMIELQLPEATWLIIEANGALPKAVQNAYKSFYTEWLPNSGYDLDDLPVIECYLQENRQEVWIGIKPISN